VLIAALATSMAALSPEAEAAINEFQEGEQKKADAATVKRTHKVPWRNSTITYENVVSALSFSQGAEPTYNPYYAQSFSFRPRYYLRDDLSLRARLDLEIELTTSDSTDHAREWILSDLFLDANYAPSWLSIPLVKIRVNPSLSLGLPTSIASRGRSLMLSLAPGLTFRREFRLLRGRFLKSVGLAYGFRATKYVHEYATAQVDTQGVCSLTNPNSPSCMHTGRRNTSWRLGNSFTARVQITERLSFSASLFLLNDLLHPLSGEEVSLDGGATADLGSSQVNQRASTWAIFDLSYDLLDWLWLSAGVSTFNPQLRPDSSYRAPFFNRFTAFYFDLTVPVDRLVSQVQGWVGHRGQAR
jgi:hypothetical protein